MTRILPLLLALALFTACGPVMSGLRERDTPPEQEMSAITPIPFPFPDGCKLPILGGWRCACPPQPTRWERFEPFYWLAVLAVFAFLAWRAWLFYAPLRRRSR